MQSEELQKHLAEANSTLELLQARRDSELSRMRREILEGEEYFERLFAKDKEEIERIENELKAEVSREKASWKEWPQAELIRRWETGDFDYEHFKDTDNALVLRYAYKACMPDAEPRSVSRIMRVSAQVAAGWYKTPLEAPHCNPPRDKSDEASPKATPLKKTPAKMTATKATPAGLTPTKATPAKTATAKAAKTAPPKTPPAKAPSSKITPATTSKPKTTPAIETNVARGTEAVKSLVEKVQAKKTPVKKTRTKKNTTVNTSAEPNQITTPTPVRGIKRAHDTTALADEMDGGESQQQSAGKTAKISM